MTKPSPRGATGFRGFSTELDGHPSARTLSPDIPTTRLSLLPPTQLDLSPFLGGFHWFSWVGRVAAVSWPGDIDSDATFCCHHPNWQAGPTRPKQSCHKIREKEIIQCLPLLLRAPGQAAQIPVDDRACGPKLISISDYRRRDQTNISPLIPMHDATCGVDCAQIPF